MGMGNPFGTTTHIGLFTIDSNIQIIQKSRKIFFLDIFILFNRAQQEYDY